VSVNIRWPLGGLMPGEIRKFREAGQGHDLGIRPQVAPTSGDLWAWSKASHGGDTRFLSTLSSFHPPPIVALIQSPENVCRGRLSTHVLPTMSGLPPGSVPDAASPNTRPPPPSPYKSPDVGATFPPLVDAIHKATGMEVQTVMRSFPNKCLLSGSPYHQQWIVSCASTSLLQLANFGY